MLSHFVRNQKFPDCKLLSLVHDELLKMDNMIFKSHFTSVEENVKMRRFLGLRTGHETIMTKMGFPEFLRGYQHLMLNNLTGDVKLS